MSIIYSFFHRDSFALSSIDKLKTNGLLLIDDAHRYLASNSNALNAVKLNSSPSSIVWSEFLQQVNGWRRIWFTDSVHDACIFVKPCND